MYEMKTSFSILQEFVRFVWELLFIQERSNFYQASWEYTLGEFIMYVVNFVKFIGWREFGENYKGVNLVWFGLISKTLNQSLSWSP